MTARSSREEANAAGRPLYFGGAPCKRGHADGRRVSNGVCITCDRTDKRSPQFRATAKAYFQSEQGKAARRRHNQSETSSVRLARYRAEGRDREWQQRHYATGRKRETLKAWGKRNRDKTAAWWALYNAARENATPKWLTAEDKAKIAQLYAEAKRLGLTVDHIVPIRGKAVCGLHVPWNLQLLSQSENSRKNKKLAAEGEIPSSRRHQGPPILRYLPDPDTPAKAVGGLL
jgi:5-methylcytosine-specific restriction endonuclease McrA